MKTQPSGIKIEPDTIRAKPKRAKKKRRTGSFNFIGKQKSFLVVHFLLKISEYLLATNKWIHRFELFPQYVGGALW